MKSRCPTGGNDRVMTPPSLAERIVRHFGPLGRILDPCRGDGAFFNAFPQDMPRDWCEITEGRDFLTHDFGPIRFSVTLTNPPWSQYRAFQKRAMEVSDSVIFLSNLNAYFLRARIQDVEAAGFGLVEILLLDTPDKPWPQTGFQLGATYIRRGYSGPVKMGRVG